MIAISMSEKKLHENYHRIEETLVKLKFVNLYFRSYTQHLQKLTFFVSCSYPVCLHCEEDCDGDKKGHKLSLPTWQKNFQLNYYSCHVY